MRVRLIRQPIVEGSLAKQSSDQRVIHAAGCFDLVRVNYGPF
jgi:hypothetical protein